jgi:hypothetical protein
VQWRDAAPEEIVKDVAPLQSRLMLDAPTGDLAVEQPSYDADRVRSQEATELGRGHSSYSTAARHDATGQIVALTKLSFGERRHPRPTTNHDRRTVPPRPASRPDREVRNHSCTQANEPALRVIDAWNAEENTHMRAVNTTLGFQPVDSWPLFQLPVPAT